jgi:multisubunit Na+/H+ antiporter MnhB subunit
VTVEIILVGLMLFLLLGSIVALELRNLLSAVIAIGVVGLGLSILFLLLGAPDIAITQVVVEVLVVTVLIRMASRVESDTTGPRRDRVAVAIGMVFVLVFAALLVGVFTFLPPPGEGGGPLSAWYLEHGAERTGATNIVTAILLDFRAYDTLGEATVILASIAGVLAILRPGGGKRRHARKPSPPPESSAAPPHEEHRALEVHHA